MLFVCVHKKGQLNWLLHNHGKKILKVTISGLHWINICENIWQPMSTGVISFPLQMPLPEWEWWCPCWPFHREEVMWSLRSRKWPGKIPSLLFCFDLQSGLRLQHQRDSSVTERRNHLIPSLLSVKLMVASSMRFCTPTFHLPCTEMVFWGTSTTARLTFEKCKH